MATTASFLLLIAAVFVVVLLLSASSTQALDFQNCTAYDETPFAMAITKLETYPDPAKSNNNLTITITVNTGPGLDSLSSGLHMFTEIVHPTLPGFLSFGRDEVVCGGGGGRDTPIPCPAGANQEVVFSDTFALPLTTLLPGDYTLKVYLRADYDTLICIRSSITITLL